jgi:mevalonate kinase
MKQKICVSAPGKLILLGEHTVVYGKPAIIASVFKRCFITITPRDDANIIEIVSETFNASIKLSVTALLKKSVEATRNWQEFGKTNNSGLLKLITAEPLDYAAIIIGETLAFSKNKLPSGFTLTINSEIPVGSGMGSSAALAVSIAGALLCFLGEKFDREKINSIAFLAEQKKHGFPSGGDNSACCYGGLIWYKKETPELKIISQIPFKISEKIAKNFLAIFTGTPQESTGEMVSLVRTVYQKRRKFTQSIFTNQEILVQELLPGLKNGDEDEVIRIMKQGEKNLERLGVVSPVVKSLIKEIEKKGGAAKICGGGGKTRGTGIVLAYHKNRKELETLLKSNKFDFSPISLGDEGVRLEL